MSMATYKTILETEIDNNNITAENVQAWTKAEVAALLSVAEEASFWSNDNIGFHTNLMRHAMGYVANKITKAQKNDVGAAIQAALDANFPGYTVKAGNGNGILYHIRST